MARIQPVQQSFSAGEITPRMLARSDTDGYHQSARLLENMIPYSQGPADSRGGYTYKDSFAGNAARVIEFFVSTSVGFVISISPTVVYIYNNLGALNTVSLISNGDFIEESTGWTEVVTGGAVVTFEVGRCILKPGYGGAQPAAIRQYVTGLPVLNATEVTIDVAEGEGELIVNIGTAAGLSDIHTGTYSGTEIIKIDLGIYLEYYIDLIVDGDQPLKIINEVKILNTTALDPVYQFPTAWTSSEELDSIQYAAPPGDVLGYPGEDHLYFVGKNVVPWMLRYNRSTRVWLFEEIPFVVGEPFTFPEAITFFEGRMWLGKGTNFWGSRSASYFDFTLTGVLPDDPLSFGFAKKGDIRWMVGARNFLIGTENAEYIVSSEGGLIYVEDIKADQQSAFGSAPIQAAQIGNKIIYVSTDGRKLRDMTWAWEAEAWTSKDLTFVSEHIAKTDKIKSIKFAQNPESILFMKTDTGKVLGCTYEPAMGIIGWHRHITEGNVLDFCILEETGTSSMWLAIDRDPDGAVIFLEKAFNESQLDGAFHQKLETPGTNIGPFLPLKSREVSVKVDGANHPNITLDANGFGEINTEATNIHIGFRYIQRFTSMPIDKGDQMGSSMGMQKRWNKIWVRILAGYMPLIGFESAELYPEIGYENVPDWLKRPAERDVNALMDIVEPPTTEDVQITQLSYDKYATVHIIQDLPFKTTILGFFGEMDQENI